MTLMDTAQLLGNVGEFIGAIVIVITLMYLALQIRQNTNALHAQSRLALVSAAQAELFAGMQHPSIVLIQVKSKLTSEEHVRLSYWLTALMRVREFAWLQYRHGVVDEIQWRTESLVIQTLLSRRNTRTWWASVGRRMFPTEFVDFVDDLIRDQPPTDESHWIQSNWTNIARQADAD